MLNQTTVNMQYTRDIGNLGDDQRRKLQPSETLINKISRQRAITDILMAHGFSAVCAHDVFEQFFRWTLVASVDPSVKTQRDAL